MSSSGRYLSPLCLTPKEDHMLEIIAFSIIVLIFRDVIRRFRSFPKRLFRKLLPKKSSNNQSINKPQAQAQATSALKEVVWESSSSLPENIDVPTYLRQLSVVDRKLQKLLTSAERALPRGRYALS